MFSVIVPTYNRGRLIARTLESLLAQRSATPFEVVVVDNNSSDDTAATVHRLAQENHGRLRYVFEAAQGSSAARNAGIAATTSEFIAFVDDDAVAAPDWLEALHETFRAHPDAWCVGGRVILDLPEPLPAWFDPRPGLMTTFLSRQDLGDGVRKVENHKGFVSANLAVRREALRRVGVFDVHLGRFGLKLLCGEDVELVRRISLSGGGVYYCGRATVIHLVPPSRVTKRFFRERAYWEGRTDRLLRRLRGKRPPASRLGTEALLMLKDAAKALGYLGFGHGRRSFEHELAARKRLGFLWPTRTLAQPARDTSHALKGAPGEGYPREKRPAR